MTICRITKCRHSFGRIKNVELQNAESTFCEEFGQNVKTTRTTQKLVLIINVENMPRGPTGLG